VVIAVVMATKAAIRMMETTTILFTNIVQLGRQSKSYLVVVGILNQPFSSYGWLYEKDTLPKQLLQLLETISHQGF